MPGSNRYSTYQGNFGTLPTSSSNANSTPSVLNDDLRSIKSFSEAFRTARLRGLSTFKWGKSVYNTKLKGESTSVLNKNNKSILHKTPSITIGPLKNEGIVEDKTPSIIIGPLKNEGIVKEGYYLNPSRIISKLHYVDMINKGFNWDSNKQMWYKSVKPTIEVEMPLPIGILKTTYLQLGGLLNMNENQKEFIAYLLQVSGANNEQEFDEFILSIGKEGLQYYYQQFVLSMEQGTQSAKNGAKLNYIKQLRGKCPEGYELEFYEKGGKVCSKCMKKGAIPYTPIQGEKGTKVVQDFKNEFKKKKVKKNELGGTLDFFKCGGKMNKDGLVKKKSGIPIKEKFISEDKCGGKMKKKKKK